MWGGTNGFEIPFTRYGAITGVVLTLLNVVWSLPIGGAWNKDTCNLITYKKLKEKF